MFSPDRTPSYAAVLAVAPGLGRVCTGCQWERVVRSRALEPAERTLHCRGNPSRFIPARCQLDPPPSEDTDCPHVCHSMSPKVVNCLSHTEWLYRFDGTAYRLEYVYWHVEDACSDMDTYGAMDEYLPVLSPVPVSLDDLVAGIDILVKDRAAGTCSDHNVAGSCCPRPTDKAARKKTPANANPKSPPTPEPRDPIFSKSKYVKHVKHKGKKTSHDQTDSHPPPKTKQATRSTKLRPVTGVNAFGHKGPYEHVAADVFEPRACVFCDPLPPMISKLLVM